MTFPLNDDPYYIGPPVTDDMILRAEETLGVRLPRGYIDMIRRQNGGGLQLECFPTPFPTSWAPTHVKVYGIWGIGGENGIDTTSDYMINEWNYPRIGVVLCDMPSAGHDAIMLDYSECGPEGEPAVVYVDEDRVPRRIADSFDAFLAGLVSCVDLEGREE